MSQFIASDAAVDMNSSIHVKRILSGRDVRIASAFLGQGAETQVPADARLVCDIGMGGTNPAALEALSHKLGSNLKYLPDFHAKVYLSDKGCIVGSANLSNRGIGFLAQATLLEAAILLEPGEAAVDSASGWFSDIWKKARVVGPEEIEWARSMWRQKGGTPDARRQYNTLLEALEDPDGAAQEWRYLVTRDELSGGVLKWATSQHANVATEAGMELTDTLDQFSELDETRELEERAHKNCISLHRDESGDLHLTALRFLCNRHAPGELADKVTEDPVVVSFFSELAWKDATGMPKLKPSVTSRKSGLSTALGTTEDEEIFGRVLTAEEFRQVLLMG